MSTVTDAGTAGDAAAAVASSQLVASVYANYPCHPPDREQKIVPDSIVNLGKAGPVVMF